MAAEENFTQWAVERRRADIRTHSEIVHRDFQTRRSGFHAAATRQAGFQGDNLIIRPRESLFARQRAESEIGALQHSVRGFVGHRAIRVVDFWKDGDSALYIVSGIDGSRIVAGYISATGGIDAKPGELRIDALTR